MEQSCNLSQNPGYLGGGGMQVGVNNFAKTDTYGL